MTKKGKEQGLTALEKQLLMVDDDDAIMFQDDRDSVKLGQYLIGEKIQYQNQEMEAE